ncbi:aryl-sulfate sulfotransferase [Paraliomyxa miuraensis]|uniref:aryl-sulfate sulfotransferase n=1 Tax=Paraliomyxa miuraensis TaxID=376150 RepID=UPI00225A2CED|nr:aryl-sulfate sulfotransferase [Paraliomyxa miuraensis]MCX4247845.1 aryl-sulfate sulfotransferase [Paraliomyxa miuraensis]
MTRLLGSSLASSLAVLGLSLASACGDDQPVQDGDGSSTGASAEGSTGTTVAVDESSSGPGVDTTADGSSSSGDLPPLELEVVSYTYPNQPMVIDLSFSVPQLEVTIEHETDPGIRSAVIEADPEQTWVRVRGLAPDTEHPLSWSALAPDGRTAEGELTVTTETALPGFRPSFTIEGPGGPGTGTGYGGYVLFDLLALTPEAPASIFVLDTEGTTRWHLGRSDGLIGPTSVFAGAKLRADGTLLYLRDLNVYVIDEMGVEQLVIASVDLGLPGLHHDVIELPSGNFLALAFTFRDIDYPDIGLTHVAGDLIVELSPEGELVWEWDSFDHLDPLRRRDGFDDLILDPETGEFGKDWTHGNGIVHREDTDTITFSMRHQDWIIEVDHGTGDVLWRLGEEGDFTLTAGTWQYHQHSPEWQDDGTLLLYDNGLGNPGLPDPMETSRAVRYAIDTGAMEVTQVWEDAAEDFVSPIAGDSDRLPDGSILVTDSSIGLELGPQAIYSRVREIDEPSSDVPQWWFTTELGTFIYRCIPTELLPGELP